jgi:hypothetical protein
MPAGKRKAYEYIFFDIWVIVISPLENWPYMKIAGPCIIHSKSTKIIGLPAGKAKLLGLLLNIPVILLSSH